MRWQTAESVKDKNKVLAPELRWINANWAKQWTGCKKVLPRVLRGVSVTKYRIFFNNLPMTWCYSKMSLCSVCKLIELLGSDGNSKLGFRFCCKLWNGLVCYVKQILKCRVWALLQCVIVGSRSSSQIMNWVMASLQIKIGLWASLQIVDCVFELQTRLRCKLTVWYSYRIERLWKILRGRGRCYETVNHRTSVQSMGLDGALEYVEHPLVHDENCWTGGNCLTTDTSAQQRT